MPHPNILWICTDQQRFDTIGALGNPHIHTPNIDRLVAEGVAFTHAYCQNPICTPSRASFLTGRYPSSIRACMNGNERWAEAAPLVTAQLAEGGYDCGLVGKLHLSAAAGRIEPRPAADGYRAFDWSHHPKNDWAEGHAYAEWLREKGFDPDRVRSEPENVPPEWHQSSWCAERAIAFMNEPRKGPWLFSCNFFDPHPPLDPPGAFLDRYDPATLPGAHFEASDLDHEARLGSVDFQSKAESATAGRSAGMQAAYYAMIELIDHTVGRMLEALETSGQLSDTVVIFMSDHGEMLGDHGLHQKGCRFYEGLVRVPLIMRLPDGGGRGRRRNALVELVDLAPTLRELAGLPPDEAMHGRSLLPLVRGSVADEAFRKYAHSEYFGTLELPGSSRASMIRDRRYKCVVYHGLGYGELYDLESDPWEHRNLWASGDHRETRDRLIREAFDHLARHVDLGPRRIGRF